MTTTEDPRGLAVEQLSELGLGLYAARTFVALVVLSGGTALEVSRVAEVPRTRVYDAAEELSEFGLVTVDNTTPRRFSPVDREEATEILLARYRCRVETLERALASLDEERSAAG